MGFSEPNIEPKTVLCVDDEPIIRDLCVNALDDYHVVIAEDGIEALNVLETIKVDIVLSDINMPNMDGLELLQKIKEERPDLAVILMTGYSDSELILQALKTGADDFINKPINILQLSTTVEKVSEKLKIRQELADLKQIDKLKSDFLGLISHKLKTPTTAISLFIQNIAEGIESPDDDDFQLMLALVQTETTHLEQLIQDLLYFSEATLHSDNIHLEPLDLGLVATKIVETMQPTAQRHQIILENNITPPLAPKALLLSAQRINFAIRALIDNAIKFSQVGNTVTITGKTDAKTVSIQVKDCGAGISKLELTKIFNKFYQIDPEHTGQVRGFGLGLYYARDFIRSMGGQLQIESKPNIGTIATIQFPLHR